MQTDLQKGVGSYGITAFIPGLGGHGGTVKHPQTLTLLRTVMDGLFLNIFL